MTTETLAGVPGIHRFTPAQLLRVARLFAADPALTERLDLTSPDRQWALLETTPTVQVWLLSWPVGVGTGWHDHHGSAGAFHVVQGTLNERSYAAGLHHRILTEGEGRAFSPKHIHDVSNRGGETAVSVHVYAPALTRMTRYELEGGRPRVVGVEKAGVDW